jgi:hypothetical protein
VTRRLAVVALAVVALAGVAGIGAASAGQDTTAACELLTTKEVEKALGEPVLDGVAEAGTLPGDAGEADTCTWSTEDPDTGIIESIPLAIVVIIQSGCAPDAAECFENDELLERDFTDPKPLKKLGDDAFYEFTGMVEVLVDDLILDVHFSSFDEKMFSRKEFERRTVKLAKKAVARLES